MPKAGGMGSRVPSWQCGAHTVSNGDREGVKKQASGSVHSGSS